ncbi:MAG: imidazole glycerol phosphate synthase subunit HisH [Solirubrobacteraceae bacterium]|nr:imidazole glycerol phosphate synthase subunit HisH [Solirubrobacteraceae bacterium]
MGNRRSVVKAFERVGAEVELTSDEATLERAEGLVVPGVGAFPEAMRRLTTSGLDDLVRSRSEAGIPIIGLCLGMQLLFERSVEHEGAEGLGLLGGDIRWLDPKGQKLPHIGWNLVKRRRESALLTGIPDPMALYHVHSFVAHPTDPEDVLATGEYGSEFVSLVARGTIFGAQCHPEKSSTHGLQLLRNYVKLCREVAFA